MQKISLVLLVFCLTVGGCSKGHDAAAPQEQSRKTVISNAQTAPTAKAMTCCQCSAPGSPTTPMTPVSCVGGVTNQTACDTTCAPNVGGIMNGTCANGVSCVP